jgi:AcrR family transcriptional regulator
VTAASTEAAGPRSSKGARTRTRLLEAAKEIFEENGFLSARISDIAERAGLSHGSFYHYFESKEQIFREVAAMVDEELGAPLAEVVLAPSSDLSPHERLREAVRRHFEAYRAEARIMGLIEQVSRYDDHVNDLMLSRHRQYQEQMASSIRQLQKRNLADKSLDPAVVAAAIGALTGRFAELWLVQGAIQTSMEAAVDQVSTMLVSIMGIPKTEARRR